MSSSKTIKAALRNPNLTFNTLQEFSDVGKKAADHIDKLEAKVEELRGEKVMEWDAAHIMKLHKIIGELENKVEELTAEASRMNAGRSCKVCGEDYVIAEIGERMGFRVDVALLENQRLQAKVDELETELTRMQGRHPSQGMRPLKEGE